MKIALATVTACLSEMVITSAYFVIASVIHKINFLRVEMFSKGHINEPKYALLADPSKAMAAVELIWHSLSFKLDIVHKNQSASSYLLSFLAKNTNHLS